MTEYLFVYGTLMTGERNHFLLEPFIESAEPALLNGMDLLPVTAEYPGIVPGPGAVRGELVALKPDRLFDALAVLDELEDYYGPGRPDNLYEREEVQVRLTDATTCQAWTYRWVGSVEGLKPIPQGDWRAYAR